MLWKCCKNIVDITLFFLKFLPRFRQPLFFFFSPIFGNGIATNFFPPISAMALPQLVSVNRNFSNVITEIQNFLSPTFSLSLTYFCWILTTLTLFPQFPKELITMPITQINSEFNNIQPKDSFSTSLLFHPKSNTNKEN